MPRRFAVLLALALLLPVPGLADYAGGVAAWGRGDYGEALRRFRPSAEAGDAESQFMLGRLYAMGLGVPQDFIQAWVWHDRAARQGHREALDSLRNLEQVLTPAQLAQARAAGPPEPREKVPAIDTGAFMVGGAEQVGPPPGDGGGGGRGGGGRGDDGRVVVLNPRTGRVAGEPPARLSAPAATFEGMLMAGDGLDEPVCRLQRDLNRSGYDAGRVDGILGPSTRQAIRAFQRDQGLPQDGLMTSQLLARLATPIQQAGAPP
jgi:hypothetical protein